MLDYLNALRSGMAGNALRAPGELLRIALARSVFKMGPRPYSLYGLSRKAISSWGSYLDDTPTKASLRMLNPKKHHAVVDDKLLFYRECLRRGLPTVPILAVHCADRSAQQDTGLPGLQRAEDLADLLQAHPNGLFFKPHDGRGGKGAFGVLPEAGGWRFPHGTGTAQDVFAYCRGCAESSILLVQPRLMNMPAIRPLMADSGFGTIRAVTYMRQGKPQLLAACLRIVAAGNSADNFQHGTTGNFVAPIDPDSGRLICLRASRSRSWPEIYRSDVHPVNAFEVTGFELPMWKESRELALRGQLALRQLPTLGWDVGVTEQGPVLLEANSMYDFDILQIAFDRGFRPDLQSIVAAIRQ